MITWNWFDTDSENEWTIFTHCISLTGPFLQYTWNVYLTLTQAIFVQVSIKILTLTCSLPWFRVLQFFIFVRYIILLFLHHFVTCLKEIQQQFPCACQVSQSRRSMQFWIFPTTFAINITLSNYACTSFLRVITAFCQIIDKSTTMDK